jgi:uncharacterized repeat protein (TIGR01451 family)
MVTSTVTVGQQPTIDGAAPAGMAGTAYSYAYMLTGSPTPTVTLTSGTLPAGLTLSSAGVLSGTPTTPGSYTFTATASNGVGASATVTNTLVIAPGNTPTKADIVLTITAPATAKVGTNFTYTVATKNLGPAAATQVVTVVRIPDGTTLVSTSLPVTRHGQVLYWTTPTIANGATITNLIVVKPVTVGSKTTLGVAGSVKTPDPKLVNNLAYATTTAKQ